MPSFEWFAGALTVTVVPAVQLPPSTRYSVLAMPERSEPGVRVTVASVFWAPNEALSVVVGAVLSTTTSCGRTEQRPMAARSVTATHLSQRPSADHQVSNAAVSPEPVFV